MDCPYFDQNKAKKGIDFIICLYFAKKKPCLDSNEYEIQECLYFLEFTPICPYFWGFRVGSMLSF